MSSRKRRRNRPAQSWTGARASTVHRCSCGHAVVRASLPSVGNARIWAAACANSLLRPGPTTLRPLATREAVQQWAQRALRRDDTAFVPLKLAYGRFLEHVPLRCDSENNFVSLLCGEAHCGLQQRADRGKRACAGKGVRGNMRVIPHFAFAEDDAGDVTMAGARDGTDDERSGNDSAGSSPRPAAPQATQEAAASTDDEDSVQCAKRQRRGVSPAVVSSEDEDDAAERRRVPAVDSPFPRAARPAIAPPSFTRSADSSPGSSPPLRHSPAQGSTAGSRREYVSPPRAASAAVSPPAHCAGLSRPCASPGVLSDGDATVLAAGAGTSLSIAQAMALHEIVTMSPAGLLARIEEDLQDARGAAGAPVLPRWLASLMDLEAAYAPHHRAALRNALWVRWVTAVVERRAAPDADPARIIKFLDVEVKTVRVQCAQVSDAAAAERCGAAAILAAVAGGSWNNGVNGTGTATHAAFAADDVLFAMWYGTARMLARGAPRVLWIPSRKLLNPRAFTCDASEARARGLAAIVSLSTALGTLREMPMPKLSVTSVRAHSVLSLLIAVRFTGEEHTYTHGQYLDFVSAETQALEPAVAATLARLWPAGVHGRFYSNLRVCGFARAAVESMRSTTNAPFLFRVNLILWTDGRTPASERVGFALAPSHMLLPHYMESDLEKVPLPPDLWGMSK